MRTLQIEGVILKRKNSGEADRILTVFTKELGKMQIKAIGVRKIASKRSSHVELLNVASLSIYKGKSMPILTEAVTVESWSSIKENLSKIAFAYHICEIVDGLCPEGQESGQIFDLLVDVLGKLGRTEDASSVISNFEIQLLTFLGYWSSEQLQKASHSYLIEGILERKLKTRSLLGKLQ